MSSLEPLPLGRRQISPLDLPELLELIFTFVDTKTLVTSVPLVCRQWFLINQNRSNRVFEWVSSLFDPQVDKALRKLQKADTLCCRLCEPSLKPTAAAMDEKLWKVIKENHASRYLAPTTASRRGHHRQATVPANGRGIASTALNTKSPDLRQLILEGFFTMQLIMERFLSYFPCLRILKIHTTYKSKNDFCVKFIMQALPCLETLHFQHTGTMNALALPGAWTEESTGTMMPLTRHRLRSLVIINAWIPQASLEEFLGICPHLRELKLVLLQYPYKPGPYYDPARLLRHIRNLSLDLWKFHFSDRSSLSDPALERQLNLELCPQATNRIFRGAQFTPDVFRALDRLPNVLTTLELLGECKFLHNYLCESPFLVHLKAPLTDMPIQHLDIHMSGNTRPTMEQAAPPRVWACQGLQTLQLLFRGGQNCIRDGNRNSMVVFGYISRVCPLLQVLEVYGPEVQMDEWVNPSTHRIKLDLSSGLVLLTRLRHLRRLLVGASDAHQPTHLGLKRVDVDWMVASGYSDERRQVRQAVMDSWKSGIQDVIKNHETGIAQIPQVSSNNNQLDSPGNGEPELMYQLRHLGHKMDVILVLEEMHSAGMGYIVWPEMEEVSFYCLRYRGLALDQEVDRLLSPPPLVKSKVLMTPQPTTRTFPSASHSPFSLPALKRRFQRLARGVLRS
ncbi:hypothetical protein BG015_007965 [Linnemannia schmuckeri]|uniref:F-box domain-containing protein n=1 Tax=Linnemannia schmuckeri TaxID=64567 RepID=A0A9P5S6K6_9FUNG|nr:hypothetical protein BG015_007965 [Linnemannia schmuckeri]